MALRVGSVGLRLEASGSNLDWLRPLGALVGLGRNYSWIGPAMLARAVRQTIGKFRFKVSNFGPSIERESG